MDIEEDQCPTKPQLLFKDTIDNSDSHFQHKILDKPNALIPLQESKSHPYEYEITKHIFSQEQYASEREILVPQSMHKTPFSYVDTIEQLQDLSRELDACKEFAVDLEQHSFRSYQGFTCLMQISTREKDYIIDTITLRAYMPLLNNSFTNPSIVKVLHGADDDVPWLQRDLGLYIVNLFDTKHAARILQYKLSLFDLLTKYCSEYTADKSLQRVDWRVRPLPPHMVEYARSDTHYLLYLYDILHNDLVKMGSTAYLTVLDKGRETCLRQYEKKKLHPNFKTDANFGRGYKEYCTLYSTQFNSQQDFVIKKLYEWRDKTARTEDEGVRSYVMQKPFLFGLVHHAIENETQFDEFVKKYPSLQEGNRVSPLVPKYKQEILNVIHQAKTDHGRSIQEEGKKTTETNPKSTTAVVPSFFKSSIPWNPALAKNILRDYFLNGLKLGEPVYETQEGGLAHQKTFSIQIRIPILTEDNQNQYVTIQSQGGKKRNVEMDVALKACTFLMEKGALLVNGYALQTALTHSNSNSSTLTMDIAVEENSENSFGYKGHLFTVEQAKAILQHHYQIACKKHPEYINQAVDSSEYNGPVKVLKGQKVWIAKVLIPGDQERYAFGESASKRDSEKIAAFHAIQTLADENALQLPKNLAVVPSASSEEPVESTRKRKSSQESITVPSLLPPVLKPPYKPEDSQPIHYVASESLMICAKCSTVISPAEKIAFEGAHMIFQTDLAQCSSHAKSKNMEPLILGNIRYELTQQETTRKYKPFKMRCNQCLAGIGSIVMQGRDMKACISASDVLFQTPTQKLTANQVKQAELNASMESSPSKKAKVESPQKIVVAEPALDQPANLEDNNRLFFYELSFEPFEEVVDTNLNGNIFVGFYLICPAECFVRTLVVQKQKNTKRKKSAIAKFNPLGTMVLTRSEILRVRTIHTFFQSKFLKQQKKWNYTSFPELAIPFVLCIPRFKSLERNLGILDHIRILEDMMQAKPVSPVLQQIMARHNTDSQQVREQLKTENPNEAAKKVIEQLQQVLYKKCLKTRYNDLCYFVSEADFTQSPMSNTQKQKKQENAETSMEFETYLEYYQTKGLEIKDTTQPLLVVDFRKIIGELHEIPEQANMYNKLYLIPEHCDMIQFTLDMYIYGLFLGHVFQHMEETSQYMNTLIQWQNSIGHRLENKLLLKQAFCHPSYAHEKEVPQSSNATLEFLGDAVLEIIFSVYLFMKNRDATEGMLCADRQPFIRNENLQRIASGLGMHQLVQVAKKQNHILEDTNALFHVNADVLEAFIGALYLDKGMESASKFVVEQFGLDCQTVPVGGAIDASNFSDSLLVTPEDELKFKELENRIGIQFNNRKLLKQAFTHSSSLPEDVPLTCSYERLEWLGDSCLKLIATLYVYSKYPKHLEGTLTTYRVAYIMNENLAQCAFKLNLQDIIQLSPELASQLNKMETDDQSSSSSHKIYGDVIESLIGAIFVEKGFAAAKSFVERFVIDGVSPESAVDPKGLLQHLVQKEFPGSSLSYKVLNDQNGVCEVGVMIDGEMKAKASGINSLKATKKAAEIAVQQLTQN